ncbi:MAG: endolytic transglycosylase MltG [Thiotrichales bacterium]|nr:endolytic transglycosylase MltG [Thiotrichales bacterium]
MGVVVLTGLVLWVLWHNWLDFKQQPISQLSEPLVLQIEKGASATQIAQQLHQQGFMAKPQWFVWYLRYQNQHHLLKAGEFRLSPDLTVDQLIAELIKGESVYYPATLVAGQTFTQMLKQLQTHEKLARELDLQDIPALKLKLGVEGESDSEYPYALFEGRFLPETYFFTKGESDLQILLRAKAAMEQTLNQSWSNRQPDLPLQSAQQALVLASIVEKETGLAAERPLIAGVFVNRLRQGMRLQTDPTVIYGAGADYDGNIRRRDLNAKNAYNTYQIEGLPPTPIAMPSKEAIEAVLNPQTTDALFFVAKGGGAHQFSVTLEEHNRAVKHYLLQQ